MRPLGQGGRACAQKSGETTARTGTEPCKGVPSFGMEASERSARGADHAKRRVADQALEIVLHGDDELIVVGDVHQRQIPDGARPMSFEGTP